MAYNRDIHHRQSIRLQGYDYSQAGVYYVTLCTTAKQCLFGDVVVDKVALNVYGNIAEACWMGISTHFSDVQLDEFVVMPNHLHGIIVITSTARATHASPLQQRPGPARRSLGAIMGSFKSAATKQINLVRNSPGEPIWQRNFYEHIVRSDANLNAIRQYIQANPARWAEDNENPRRQPRNP